MKAKKMDRKPAVRRPGSVSDMWVGFVLGGTYLLALAIARPILETPGWLVGAFASGALAFFMMAALMRGARKIRREEVMA